MKYYLGLDLGGTNIKAGIIDEQTNLVASTSTPTNSAAGPDAVIDRMVNVARDCTASAGLALDDLVGIGIGSPGTLSCKRGLVIAPPNLPGWRNVPIRQRIAQATRRPCVLENDANAAAWGEFCAGAGKDVDNLVMMTLGTGIGGGIIVDGQIIHGTADGGAEIGHMIIFPGGRKCGCGQLGCIEAHASATAVSNRALEAVHAGRQTTLARTPGPGQAVSCKDVFDAAIQGDPLANEIVDDTARALGVACINMLHLVEPQRIVFAGGMIAAGDFLLDRIKRHYNQMLWTLKPEDMDICYATLGDDAGIIGAAGVARLAEQTGELVR